MTTEPESAIGIAASRVRAKRLYRDAAAMASSSVATAALGMGFWALAAKLFPPDRLGVMSAVLSVITAVGTVVAACAGDSYTALLPAAGPARGIVYRRGQRVWVCLALLGGIAGGLITVLTLPQVKGSLNVALLVAFGVVAWSGFLVQNSTLISVGRARWLPALNSTTSLSKIALLLALGGVVLIPHAVELAAILPAALSVLVLRPTITRMVREGRGLPQAATMPEERALGEYNKMATQLVTMALLSYGGTMITPFFVTKFGGPSEGALFGLILTIVQTLDFLAAAMAVSLVVHASSAPQHGGAMARAILLRTVLLVAVSGAVLTALVPTVLRLINKEYGEMGAITVTALLCLGSVFRVFYAVWASLQRSRRNMRAPLLLNFVAATLLFALVPTLSSLYGATGGAVGVLVQQVVLAIGAVGQFAFRRFIRSRRAPS